MKSLVNEKQQCPLEDVAAYLDGELTGATLERFEAHLRDCQDCATELREQRQLLCTLDLAFNDQRSFALPRDFTRVVAAHAESDFSGMRKKSERRRALKLCAILGLVSFALLGAATRTLVLDPLRSFLHIAGRLLNLFWQTAYDLGAGVIVIVRVVGRATVLGPRSLWVFLALALVISLSLLPFLIAKYHRAQIIE
jgi:predicted anti-sigma-YlaC factor YlaD